LPRAQGSNGYGRVGQIFMRLWGERIVTQPFSNRAE
jgi:hypothetical protein